MSSVRFAIVFTLLGSAVAFFAGGFMSMVAYVLLQLSVFVFFGAVWVFWGGESDVAARDESLDDRFWEIVNGDREV